MLRFLTAGESHGCCLTAIVDGFPAGLEIDVEKINHELFRRQSGYGRGRRQTIEKDEINILSGTLYGKTTGAPISLRINNQDWINWRDRWDSRELPKLSIPRPGHADYAGMIKYGFDDARIVLERASARETAARVAVGALAKQFLEAFNVFVGSYVNAIGNVEAKIPDLSQSKLWVLAEKSDVRCPDINSGKLMCSAIDEARQARDTLGGIFTISTEELPVGLGTYVQWDLKLDARLAAAVMSINAIKGIEIGPAFENARKPGTMVHDEIYPGEDGSIIRRTNRAGGIEGGMTNGEPLLIRAAMKPIASTGNPLGSVDLSSGEAQYPEYQRSDICAVPAASIVGEAMVAWTLADAINEKYGGDSIAEKIKCLKISS
jgi:chorismate synthase